MVSPETMELVRRAEQIYEQRLRTELEKAHHGEFVAIEPDSGDHFVGRTLEDAIGAARRAHPQRLSYTLRIGYPVALEIGCHP